MDKTLEYMILLNKKIDLKDKINYLFAKEKETEMPEEREEINEEIDELLKIYENIIYKMFEIEKSCNFPKIKYFEYEEVE